ncbi:hypothetical protein ACTMTI_23295 [Nonomuraea sp. H19]|uniref:hypothetical protein n=1 Tax=Nonomuraea sp. H19 TaxID=3452206 RepID=UPI003F88645A
MTGEPTAGIRRKPAETRHDELPPPDDLIATGEGDATGEEGSTGHPVLRWVLGVLANVTVLTALLVYFGWERSEWQADELGIDQSVLALSPNDYVLRSVGPVLVLVLIVGVSGLLWLQLDHLLAPRVRTDGKSDRLVRYALRALAVAWLWCPAVIWALGFVAALVEFAYVALPLSIGAGLLLTLYGTHLRNTLPGATPRTGMPLLYTFVAVIACAMLFWGTGNYAHVHGVALAMKLTAGEQMSVTVYSTRRLNLAVGAESTLPGSTDKDAYTYRYSGLRLLLHTGGRYFLIGDDWVRGKGVVIMLRESAAIRLELGP